MNDADELRVLRQRLAGLEARAERIGARDAHAGGAAIVLRTKVGATYPTAVGAYYACDPIRVGGDEEEGATVSLTAVSSTVYAGNIGTTIPPAGTEVVAVVTDGRFIFQYDGAE